MPASVTRFLRENGGGPAVRGYLHSANSLIAGLVLTHGAGSSCDAPLLVALAEEFAVAGVAVLRCDLPYRQMRPKGPPYRSDADRDREGLRAAVRALGEESGGRSSDQPPIFLGGQSYGGRQATMAAAEDANLVSGLLLISYPLHPPGRPERRRTEHFPSIEVPTFLAHGTKDAFGSPAEMNDAVGLVPSPKEVLLIEGGGHGLIDKRSPSDRVREVARTVRDAFLRFAKEALDF